MKLVYSCLCILLSFQLGAQIIFVTVDGTGTGTSWADATSDLQGALANASSGSSLWIATGKYYPTTCETCTVTDRYQSFVIPSGVKVYGGFLGQESQLNQRNWKANKTILSGDIDQDNRLESNSFTILKMVNASSETIVDGLYITDGYANDLSVQLGTDGNSGAAIANISSMNGSSSTPTITNCVFENNRASVFGGAIYNLGDNRGNASPKIEHCIFIDNHSVEGGGAIYNNGSLSGTSSPNIFGCAFEQNTCVGSGAVVYNNGLFGDASPTVINCTFSNNESEQYGGCFYNLGRTGMSSPVILNCLFYNNKAKAAGAIYNLGSASGNSSPEIINCTFYQNEADVGACIYNQANDSTGTCNTLVSNSIFWANTAQFGLVFQNGFANPSISHSLVQVNSCADFNSGLSSNVNCGQGLIFQLDPAFSNPASADFHLSVGSPAIDKGDNQATTQRNINVDLDSLPRIWDNIVDLGTYEYGATFYDPLIITRQPKDVLQCEGESMMIDVETSGTNPVAIQWYKNDQPIVGATLLQFTIDSLKLEDAGIYFCELTDVQGDQVISRSCTITTIEKSQPSIYLQSNSTTICQGTTIDFTTTISHGGAEPIYEWYINNTKLNISTSTISYDAFSDGDVIYCKLISSESCVLNSEVISNEISIQVFENKRPGISIQSESPEYCLGDTLSIEAYAEDQGDSPAYEWFVNGTSAGLGAGVFTTIAEEQTYEISCRLISSEACVSEREVTSDVLTLRLNQDNCNTTIVDNPLESEPVVLYPNPTSGLIYIDKKIDYSKIKIQVFSIDGKQQSFDQNENILSIESLPNGIYMIKFSSKDVIEGHRILKI